MTAHDPPPQMESPHPEPRTIVAKNAWAVPVMWMVIVLILVSGGVYAFKSCSQVPEATLERAGKVVETVGQQVRSVAAAFKQGNITTTFTSYATTISGSQYLQFATLSQHETFTRKDESSVAFGYIPLPDVIVEASAPVSYTYYLDLNARWDFALQDGVILVTAPDIKYNRPSVDVSSITYEVKKNSLLRNTTEAMENLRNSITWLSYKKAEANIELVRETGRKQTETFVENWLSKSFADGKKYPVKVRFRHEVGASSSSLTPKGD
jgi:hypothetical protein